MIRNIATILKHLPKRGYSFSESNLPNQPSDTLTKPPKTPPIQSPKSATQTISSLQKVLTTEQIDEQLQTRYQQLTQRHELLRREIKQKIDMPFLLCGVNRKAHHQAFGFLSNRIMQYYRIHEKTITDYLLKIYKASVHAIADNNQKFMDEYWETNFKEAVVASMKEVKEKYTLKLNHEKRYINQMEETSKIVDSLMIRGLSIDRKENRNPKQYHKYAEDVEFGLTTFTPLHLTDNNQVFIDPISNKKAYQGYEKMVIRILLLVRTPLHLSVDEIPIPRDLNTFEHLIVFQNQMQAPPHMESRYKIQTLMEWLGKYRFGIWKVVDMDNFMKSNSLFREHIKNPQIQDFFKNTKLDRSYYCNIRIV